MTRLSTLSLILGIAGPVLLTSVGTNAAVIRNHARWLDTDGNPVDCHEGSLLRVGDTFHWTCRAYKGNVNGVFGTGGAQFRCGFNCYSSTDLEHWTFRGACLSYPASGWLTQGTWHRPRLIYNAQTGKYVLWFFMFPNGLPSFFTSVVATGDSPIGPFTVLTGQDNGPAGDLATFLDQDGRGYLAYERNRIINVARLSDDFLKLTSATTIALGKANGEHEGSSIARYKGKYILAGSAVVGLDPSDTTYAIADAPLGPYTEKGFMSEQKTWQSQISAFVHIPESDTLFAMNEQWLTGPDGKRAPAEQSTQLWLPVTFDPATGVAKMQMVQEWDPWAGKQPPGVTADGGVDAAAEGRADAAAAMDVQAATDDAPSVVTPEMSSMGSPRVDAGISSGGDTAATPASDEGCSCRLAGRTDAAAARWLWALAGLLVLLRRVTNGRGRSTPGTYVQS